jgi:signal transduction histidine kinase
MSSLGRQEIERYYLGRSTRRVLIFAFGSLLAILTVAGWEAIATMGRIHAGEQAARVDFLSRAEPLGQIHSKLTLYGDLVQQPVFLTPQQSSFSRRAQQLCDDIRSALANYPQPRSPVEQSLIDNLRLMLADQDRARTEMLALHDSERMKSRVGADVLPSHLRVITAVEQIVFWNNDQFRSANSELLATFNQLRDRLKRLLIVLLASGLALSLGSIVMIASQEKEIRRRYADLAKTHEAQAQLSARLLDAQEQERLSISRELHDEVGQSLGALLVDMGRLSAILPSDDSVVQDQLRKIRQLAESSVSAVRNIALLLRPSMLDDLGLVAAIEWQAREISRRSDVEVEVQAEDIASDPREELKTCIYRITQEALNNVARHSGARHASVTIRVDERQIEVGIRDDGKGFDPQHSRGLGILGMEERARLLHGSLQVASKPGTGTEITARLPLI